MSEPHIHHFVPQFYQRGFLVDKSNRIWVYHKGLSPRRYGVKKTGMRIDLYAFRDKDGQTDFGTVERQLAKIDDQAAKIIQKLESGKELTDKDRLQLCKFVSVMWRRTPKHKDHVNKLAGVDLLPKVLEPFDELADRLSPEVRAEVERIREEYTKKAPLFSVCA